MNEKKWLTIALPKGTLFSPSVELLAKVGLPVGQLQENGRRLFFVEEEAKVRYIICRPTDIPTFVEYGAADIGLVGKDIIEEQEKDVYELLDLGYGYCRFVVAMPEEVAAVQDWREYHLPRVATKFPRVAEKFFAAQGMQVEIIKLHGNVELAPLVGLAEMIVDLVSTGRTLRENRLVEVAEIFTATARLIANRVSYQVKGERIMPLLEKIKEVVAG